MPCISPYFGNVPPGSRLRIYLADNRMPMQKYPKFAPPQPSICYDLKVTVVVGKKRWRTDTYTRGARPLRCEQAPRPVARRGTPNAVVHGTHLI